MVLRERMIASYSSSEARGAGGGGPVRRDVLDVRAVGLELRPLRPVRGDEKGMRGAEGEAPADGGVAVRNLHHRLVEHREVELIAAEKSGLHGAVEAGF